MAPKTSEQFEEIRKRSQENIQAAAFELFARRGYAQTSISQIAKAAGVSKGLLYNYFDSKEDLLLRIVEQAIEEGEEAMSVMFSEELSAQDKLHLILEGSFQMVLAKPEYWKFMTSLALQTEVAQQIEPLVKKKTDMALQAAGAIFEELGYENADFEAYTFGATLDGIMMHYISLGERYPMEEMKNYLLRRYNIHTESPTKL